MQIRCSYDKVFPIAELKAKFNPKNRNKHPKEQLERLAKILKYQGARKSAVLSNLSGFLTAGHGRILAAEMAGWTEYPVDLQDYDTEEQEYADLQADNAVALWAELDLSGINADLGDLGPDFDIDMLGIKNFKIDVLEKEEDSNWDGSPPVEPKTKPGDLYRLGDHLLLCGDATMIDHVQRLMGGGVMADLVLTDPPYNVAVNDESEESLRARNRRSDGLKIENDKMSEEDFRQFLLSTFSNYFAVMNPGAPIYVFYADSMTIPFMTTFMEAGFHFAQNCIWNKQQFVMTRKDYHYKHEPVLYGWREGKAHPWHTDRKQASVWNFDRPFKNELHPTMKPIELLEYPIQNSSQPGAVVLDLFGGSGSTLIACEKLRRKARLMELDPRYCDVIVKRWEEFTGEKAELIDG